MPQEIGPFQMKRLEAEKYLEILLIHMKLKTIEAFSYDPHGVISQQRTSIKNSAYEPSPRLEW